VGEDVSSPTMFLFKSNYIHKDFKKAISCKFDQTNLHSFFYGSLHNNFINNLHLYENNDEEYNLYKKIHIQENAFFSEQERNNLYFFAKLRNILSVHKMNGLSIFSHIFLHMFNYKDQVEIADQIWSMNIFEVSKNQHFYLEYMFSEISLSIDGSSSVVSSKSRLSNFYDLSYKISFYEKDFIKFYGYLLQEKKLENIYIKKYILNSQKEFKCNPNLNIDKLANIFFMFDDMMLMLMLFHLEKDKIMSSINGSIVMNKEFIKKQRTIKNSIIDSKKIIDDLISSISYDKHELKRCSDKEVSKIYRSICNGKM